MADDVTLDSMSGGDVVAADDIAGIKYQRVKLVEGANGTNDGDISSANPLPVSLTSTTVTGTVAVTQSGTWDEIGINDSGNSITVDYATTGSGTATGALRVELPTNGTGVVGLNAGTNAIGKLAANSGVDIGDVDVTSSALPTGAATSAKQDTEIASLSVMDDWDNTASDGASVSGDVAHDGADAGEPVKLGMKAIALKANPTEVAANDRTNWYADVSGVPFVLGGHPNILSQSLQVTDADGAQTDAAIITAGANVAVVVTKVSVMADNANTVDVSVRIGFGTANTPAADAAQVILFHPGIAPGSGVVEGSGSGILGIGASNEDVRVTCEDPVTGSINIIVTYFTTEI